MWFFFCCLDGYCLRGIQQVLQDFLVHVGVVLLVVEHKKDVVAVLLDYARHQLLVRKVAAREKIEHAQKCGKNGPR